MQAAYYILLIMNTACDCVEWQIVVMHIMGLVDITFYYGPFPVFQNGVLSWFLIHFVSVGVIVTLVLHNTAKRINIYLQNTSLNKQHPAMLGYPKLKN